MTDQTARERMLAKIRALLAKTQDAGCTEDEAMAAAAKASELMERYDLHEYDVQEIQAEPFEWQDIPMRAQWELDIYEQIGASIARFTGTVVLAKRVPGSKGRYISYWGKRGDAEFAYWLCSSIGSFVLRGLESDELHHQFGRRVTQAQRSCYRRGYLLAAGSRISEKLNAMTEARRAAAVSGGNTLVVLEKVREARNALAAAGIRTQARKARSVTIDQAGTQHGRARGDAATINRPLQGGAGAPAGLLGR